MSCNRRRFLSQVGALSTCGLLFSIGNELAAQVLGPQRQHGDRRFVLLAHHAGWWARLLRPQLKEGPASEWTLPEALAPLQSRRTQMLMLEDLYNPHGGFLHGSGGSALSVMPPPSTDFSFGGLTIDRAIARQLTSDTVPFASLNMGYPYGRGGMPFNRQSNLSADGPASPYPALGDPREIFDHYFGLVGEAVEQREKRRSLLDGIGEDIKRMESRLAGSERLRMDQYLSSIRDLEIQLDSTESLGSCVAPGWQGVSVEVGQSQIFPDLIQFYYDVAAVALACGLTRAVTIAHESTGAQPGQPRYPFSPVDVNVSIHDDLMHKLNGLDNDGTDASWQAKEEWAAPVRRVYRWRSQLVADFLDRLDNLGIGDKTLTMYFNQGGGQHHRGFENIPLILIGNPTGNLATGRYERFTKKERCISDAFVTAAQALGIDMSTFGDPDHCKGALPGAIT
ncbi:MAG: DUF1552 domain-containing protein [Nannocystaceae bacterium]